MCRHGCPQSILSDQGPNMLSQIVQKVIDLMNAKRLRTTAYQPSTDGLVERFNRTVQAMLSGYVS